MKKKSLLIGIPLALAGITGGVYGYVNYTARQIVDARMDALVAGGSYDALSYEAMQIHLNGAVTMQNLHVVQGSLEYTLENLTITNFDYTNEFPRHMDVVIDGLQLPALDTNSPDPQIAAMSSLLERLGTGPAVPLRVNYSHRYDPDKAHQTDSTMHVEVSDAFTLDMSSVTRNLQIQAVNALNGADLDPAQAQAQMMALLADAEIPSLHVTLRDEGFLDVMIMNAADQNGVAPDDFRTLLESQARNFYLFLPQSAQQLAMSTGAQIATFLEGGKTLSVSIAPEYGGNVRRLQEEIMGAVFTGDYNQIQELLNLEISAQ